MLKAGRGRAILFVVPAAAFTIPVHAQVFPTTANFNVTITIVDECILTTPITTLVFDTDAGVLTAPVLGQTTITVQCTDDTDFKLELNEGTGAGATTALRRMTGTGLNTATIDYELFQEPTLTDNWGIDLDGEALVEQGTGAAVGYIVYGRVPAQATPIADTYTDTITVTAVY